MTHEDTQLIRNLFCEAVGPASTLPQTKLVFTSSKFDRNKAAQCFQCVCVF